MLKKVYTDNELLRKFNIKDYSKQLPFALDPNFKFRFSTFNTRTEFYTKKKFYTLEQAKKYFANRTILCVLYDDATLEANIVLKEDKKRR